MKKRILCLFIVFVVALTGNSAFAITVNEDYKAPHEQISYGGRLEESEPSEFAIENLVYKTLLASADFDDFVAADKENAIEGKESSETLFKASTVDAEHNKAFENGAVKIFSADQKYKTYSLIYAGDIVGGEYYAFRCKIKTQYSTDIACNRIAAYGMVNGENKWLKDAGGNYGRYKERSEGDGKAYYMTQLICAPEGTDTFQLVVEYSKSSEKATDPRGPIYFDDFELYHVAVDPMEAVLIKPNYKGIVYGDGDADINLKVSVKESNFFEYDDLSLAVTLEDAEGYVYKKTELDTVSELTNVVFSSRGLSEGDYYLNTVLKDTKDNRTISQKELTIRKRDETYRPKNYVDDDGYFVRNGERTLLTRIYSGDNIDVAANAAKTAGIDNIAAYGWWWAYNDDTYSKKAEVLRDLGIRSHINLKEVWYGSQRVKDGTIGPQMIETMEDTIPLLYKVANDYKNDPILDGYCIFDEINPLISGEELAWGNKILAEADIDNPTYGVANQYEEDYGAYTDITDILTVDPYPIRGTEQDAANISKVSQDVKAIRKSFPNRPIGAALQGFFYSPTNDKANRSPNRQELLNMMWQALCEGATVIEWYSYDSMMSSDTTAANEKKAAEEEHEKKPEIPLRVVEVKSDEEWLADFNAVFGELNEYENILLSSEPVPNYSVTGGGDWLNIMLKRYNGKTYIFAVNNTKEAQNATVTVNGAGSYDLSFDALDVKKIEISQNDFLSPEAELIGLGFSNGKDVFAVAEGEENILYVKQDSGVINYCADISDGAKLYFGRKEVAKKGKITVRVAKEFNVTVVAEDGVTKTTKKYKVVKV